MKFVIYKDEAGEFRFRLVAKNGEIIATGESYKNRVDCEKAVDMLRASYSAVIVED